MPMLLFYIHSSWAATPADDLLPIPDPIQWYADFRLAESMFVDALQEAETMSPNRSMDTPAQADRLAGLDELYSRLQSEIDELPGPVDLDRWCGLWVHGGLLRVARGLPDGERMLVNAATTREDACRAVVEPWLDRPWAQVAWADARFKAAEGAPVTLLVEVTDGDWTLDGLPVHGPGLVTLALRPGLHRLELETSDGSFYSFIEVLQPGERLGVWEGDGEIGFAPLVPGSGSPRFSLPPHDRIVRIETEKVVEVATTPPPAPRVRVGLSGVFSSLGDLGDLFGPAFELLIPVHRGSWIGWHLEGSLGMGRGTDPRLFAITPERLGLPWLVMSRAGLRLRSERDAPVHPWLSAYGAALSTASFGGGGALGAELRLSQSLTLEPSAGADWTWQLVDGQQTRALHAALSLSRWF